VPFPYNAPPAPPSEAEYDYNNDYVVAERYAFTRANVSSTEADAAVSAGTSPAAAAAAIVQQQEQQEVQAQQPHNASNYWLSQWLHIANATAAVAGNSTNSTGGNFTAGPLDGWHPGEAFNSAAWNPSMYHPPEVPGLEAPGPVAANAGSGAGGASSDE
jgi:hypothetical protein